MEKAIISKISKIDIETLKATYGETVDLAVVLPMEGGKMSFVTPRGVGDSSKAKLVVSKKDLKEIIKMLKDDDDDVSVEFEITLTANKE